MLLFSLLRYFSHSFFRFFYFLLSFSLSFFNRNLFIHFFIFFTLNCIWCWASSCRNTDSMNCPLIVSTTMSTVLQRCRNNNSTIHGSNKTVRIWSDRVKKLLRNNNTRTIWTYNRRDRFISKLALSAGAAEYTDCISAEGKTPSSGYKTKKSDDEARVMLESGSPIYCHDTQVNSGPMW